MDDMGTCRNDTRCRARGDDGQPYPTTDPLCPTCLAHAETDVRGLVYDYVDLAQLHETSLSQAVNEYTSGGGHESPTLLADGVEALQAEILHAAQLWEHALRATHRLHNPHTWAPLWQRTVYDHINLSRGTPTIRQARAGHIVQRAVGVIAPRLDRLSRLAPATVCPAGIEDEPTEVAGWEAVQHLQALHQRARGYLGRTRRTVWVPGSCWSCQARATPDNTGPLARTEPRSEGDPVQVHCTQCPAVRPVEDYEHYQLTLAWPDKLVAA